MLGCVSASTRRGTGAVPTMPSTCATSFARAPSSTSSAALPPAALAGLPTGLGTADAGRQYYNTYFGRMWVWTGTVWHYADGGPGAGAQGATSSSAPSGGLWQACDGSSVACALDNATIGTLTASDTRASGGDNPLIQGGTGGGQVAKAAPTWDAAAKTETENAHTHTVSQTGITTVAGATQVDTGSPTGAGSAHYHTLTGANAKIKAPSEADGGLGLRVSMAWWMRR